MILQINSDHLLATLYAAIAFTLLSVAWQRKDLPFRWIIGCFGILILACGVIRAMEIWMPSKPLSLVADIVKTITAAGSVPAAIVLIRFLLKIPDQGQNGSNQELQKAERKFRTFVEAAPDAIVIVDRAGKIAVVNAQTENLFGWKREELIGQSMDMLVPQRFRDAHPGDRQKFFGNPEPQAMGAGLELFGLRKDGTEFPVEISLSPLETEEGLFFSSAIRDVTERQRLNQELQKAEKKFRTFVEAAPDAIVIVNRKGKIALVNTQAENLFGWKRKDLIGRSINVLVPKRFRDVHRLYRQKFFANPKPRAMGVGLELFGLCKDGTEFPAEISMSPLETEEGFFVLSAIRDATERQYLQKERAARLEAEAANTAKDRFLAMLGHELRTPLTPVLASVEFLTQTMNRPSKVRSAVSVIQRNVELEARLIDDILDLSAIRKGKISLNLETVDSHRILRQALDIFRTEIESKQLESEFRLEATNPFVQADSSRLMQIFWNLIKNAIKSVPERGKLLFVSHNENGRIAIELCDNGAGIEPGALGRIFDAFEQGDRQVDAGYGGLGLGLAISKTIAEAHGAELFANSAGRNEGATFTLKMDVVKTPPLPSGSKKEKSRRPKNAGMVRGDHSIRILLVDDHKDTLQTLKQLLRRLGYNVVAAESVKEALKAAEEQRFDLLMTDIGLPDGSGHDLMKKIRQHQPIDGIAVSGFGMEEDLEKSREAGFADHLIKPINVDRLQEALRRFEM